MEIDVKNRLAEHELYVGNFYEAKGNVAGALGRYEVIPKKYEDFSDMDEVFYRMASAFKKVNQEEEAAICLTEIVKGYDTGKFYEDAAKQLRLMGRTVPAVDPQLAKKNGEKRIDENFVPWKFLSDFVEAVGLKGPPDQYEIAKEEVARKKAAELAAQQEAEKSKTGSGGITMTISKTSAGVAEEKISTPGSTDKTQDNGTEKKPEPPENDAQP